MTERGFDGIAWMTPWFMVVNYLALGLVGLLLLRSRKSWLGSVTHDLYCQCTCVYSHESTSVGLDFPGPYDRNG